METASISPPGPSRSPSDPCRSAEGGARKGARDSYLDFARGLLLLSVIHIHTLYWSLAPFTPDLVRHLAYLMDIPLFFFISGYLFKNTTFWVSVRTAGRQFGRLYLQYVVISFLVAGGILLWIYFGEGRPQRGLWKSLLSIFRVNVQGEMWGVLKLYNGNLWYLRTYFPLLLLAPFLVGLSVFRRAKIPLLVFVFLGYALATYHYKHHLFLLVRTGQVMFYAIFFVLGALYRSCERDFGSKAVALSLGLNLLLAGVVFHLDGNTLLLGAYKFPPSPHYLIYTMLSVHVFLLAKPYGSRLNRPVFAPLVWAGRHSFELYLIQGAVCCLPFFFVRRLGTDNPWALYAVVFSFNVLVSFGLTGLYAGAAAAVKSAAGAVRRRIAGRCGWA